MGSVIVATVNSPLQPDSFLPNFASKREYRVLEIWIPPDYERAAIWEEASNHPQNHRPTRYRSHLDCHRTYRPVFVEDVDEMMGDC